MVKIAIDAGHGINTPGKRTPADEREWSFNTKVANAAIKYLNEYQDVTVIRLDDSTGKTDVPLRDRTNKANREKADALVSCHHNANTGKWGNWTGTETYTHTKAFSESEVIAKIVHKHIVKAYGLSNRGLKKANFHMLRETNMPSILIEGGFMDSRIDIKKMRDTKVLDAAGKAVATGLAEHFKLKKKTQSNKPSKPSKPSSNKKDLEWVGTDLKGRRVESIYKGSDGLNYYDGPRWSNPSGTFKYGHGWIVDNLYRVNGSLMYRVQNSKGDLYWITAASKYVQVI